MNIFILDEDPQIAAALHHDRHVGKMLLEAAQMMSTVAQLKMRYGLPLYKPTHPKHPCTQWLFHFPGARAWTLNLGNYLNWEHHQRFGKPHKSLEVLRNAYNLIADNHSASSIDDAPLAMPPEYKIGGIVDSYRAYYKATKMKGATWARHPLPPLILT